MNGTELRGRLVAVDWVAPKSHYEASLQKTAETKDEKRDDVQEQLEESEDDSEGEICGEEEREGEGEGERERDASGSKSEDSGDPSFCIHVHAWVYRDSLMTVMESMVVYR